MATYSARSRPRSRPARRHVRRLPSAAVAPPPFVPFARHAHIRKGKLSSQATQSTRSPLSFVYVGNLRSDVRNEDLERLFNPCGKVKKIDIRCCSGSAVPGAYSDTVYATVLFDSVGGATQALNKNNNPLLGKEIVVSPSFLGLPEASRGMGRKPVEVCGVNLTKISDTVQYAVDRIRTGGTQFFPTEEEEDY